MPQIRHPPILPPKRCKAFAGRPMALFGGHPTLTQQRSGPGLAASDHKKRPIRALKDRGTARAAPEDKGLADPGSHAQQQE